MIQIQKPYCIMLKFFVTAILEKIRLSLNPGLSNSHYA
jgi:hypothetical protein